MANKPVIFTPIPPPPPARASSDAGAIADATPVTATAAAGVAPASPPSAHPSPAVHSPLFTTSSSSELPSPETEDIAPAQPTHTALIPAISTSSSIQKGSYFGTSSPDPLASSVTQRGGSKPAFGLPTHGSVSIDSGAHDASRYATSPVVPSAPQVGGTQLASLYSQDLGELDDDLHHIQFEPDGNGGQRIVQEKNKGLHSWANARALVNGGTTLLLLLALLMLFAGYPILSHYRQHSDTLGAYGPGGTNSSGQVGVVPGVRTSLVDPDTPTEAYTRLAADGTTEMKLVFSDEFNTPGRSFYPGDDAYWEAVDLHYWATNNYEWYDPAAVTTANGALRITISQHPEHNLNFRGGMIQSWNKFCFTGGVLVANVRLPGRNNVAGLWPAIWMMGNLGRAGYGATLEGTWPYSYDACDVGTLPNQTDPVTLVPDSSVLGNCPFNRKHNSKSLSFLAGQRLSACTCPDDDHPGPKLADGTFPGRMASEIDLFEAQVNGQEGMTVSQSGQFAPFNAYYRPMAPPTLFDERAIVNSYTGEYTQQSFSGVTPTNQAGVQYLANDSAGIFTEYAVEYEPGHNGYIHWEASGKPAWRLTAEQLAADPVAGIAARPVTPEPLYILANLGVSQNFGTPSWDGLVWPSAMEIDWIRVYQAGEAKVGCDPPDYPTADYIARHQEAYTNPNLTVWGEGDGGYGALWPRNRLNPGGCSATPSTTPGSPTKSVPKAKPYTSAQIGNHQPQCDISAWNDGQAQN